MKKDILEILENDSRKTVDEIALMLGVQAEEAAAAIAEMEADGVICGYSTLINWETVKDDFVTAMIEVKVTPKRDCGFDELAKTVMMYDEVEAVSLMSGSYDLFVTVKGKDFKDIALFVAQRLSTIEGVLSTSTHFVLKTYKEKGIFIEEEDVDERGLIAP